MTKQTAVEWLVEQLKKRGYAGEFPPHLLFDQAKQMEREQKIALLKFSREMCTPDAPIDYIIKEFNKYYNETFNTKEK